MNTKWLGVAAAISLLAPACGSEAPTGDEQDLTAERAMVTVRFDVVGAAVGDLGGPEDAARASWQAACDAWVAKMTEVSGQSIEGHDCGAPADVGGNDGYLFSSTPVVHVAVRVSEGTTPASFEPGAISGDTGKRADAIVSWRAACDAALGRVQAIYGERLLAGSCGMPSDVGGNDGYRYESKLTLWTAPLQGTLLTLSGYAFETGAVGKGPSVNAWRASCDAWLADLATRADARFLDAFSCGTAQDIGGNDGYLFVSEPSARLVVPLVAGTEAKASSLTKVTGKAGDRKTALASWSDACRAALDAARSEAGSSFLGAICHAPKDVGGSAYQYESDATVWLGELAETDEGGGTPDPGATGGDPDPSSPPAADCQDRCVKMMNACNAGPVEQTCDAMCAYKPTEAQMTCAETTSCDHLEDWSQKCKLFQ